MTIRTITSIYEAMITEKINMPTIKNKLLNEDGSSSLSTEQDLLDSLKTNSKVAIWKMFMYVIAVSIWALENLWALFKEEVELIKEGASVAGFLWWTDKAKEWQYGDDLVINADNYSIEYAVIDTTKRLVEHAAAVEIDGKLVLKVRRISTDILSLEELISFETYVSKLKFAGTRAKVWNLASDELKLYYEIFYDPIIPVATVRTDVETAIDTYISNIEFDSELVITNLTDGIQLVEGVRAVEYISGAGKPANDVYSDIDTYYLARAGYCNIDAAYPLSSTITYTAKS